MSQHVVINRSRYDFQDQKTGRQVKGVNIHYLPSEPKKEDNSEGFAPIKISAPMEMYDVFSKVPGLYELDFIQTPDNMGRAKISLASAKMIKPVVIAPQA